LRGIYRANIKEATWDRIRHAAPVHPYDLPQYRLAAARPWFDDHWNFLGAIKW